MLFHHFVVVVTNLGGFPGGSEVKASACNAGRLGLPTLVLYHFVFYFNVCIIVDLQRCVNFRCTGK